VLRSAARLFHLERINAKRWRNANKPLQPTAYSLRYAALRPESEMVAHHQSLQGQAGKYRATGPCGIQVPLPRRATE